METTKRWTHVKLALATALLMPLGLLAQEATKPPETPADPTAVLKVIPADATAFVVLRNIGELDKDVQATWQNLKLPEGVVPSIVDLIRSGSKAGKDLNASGSIAVIVLNLGEAKTVDEIEKNLAFLLPSTDPAAMATAMGGEKDGEVIKLDLGPNPGVAAPKEGFLAVAMDEGALKRVMQSKDGIIKVLTPDQQKAYAKADIYAWGAFGGVSKDLRKSFRDKLDEMSKAGGMGLSQLLAMQQSNLDQLDQLFEEGKDVSFGASLNAKDGIVINFGITMKPDTEMGRQMAMVKPATGSLLVGLPNEPTIFALGAVNSPSAGDQIKNMFDAILKSEDIDSKVDKAKLTQVRDLLVKCAGSMQQLTVGVSGLPAEGGEGMIGLTLVGTVKNSGEFKANVKSLFTTGKELIVDAAKKSGESDEDIKKVADGVQWKDNAEKVGEANVDHITFDLNAIPGADADSLDQAKKVLGKEGVLIRVASVDPTHVLVTFGGGAKRFENIAGLAAKAESPLAENAAIKKVADRLPAGPKISEGYISVDQLLDTIMNIATEVGSPIPFPLKMQNAAPVAITSLKAGETGQQGEVLIPFELMRSAADMVRPLLGMMMGGPSPQQPATEEGKLN